MTIVDGGGKGRILNLGGEKGGESRWFRWKEANKLESFGVGAIAGDAVVFGDGFVECG